jgi:hypothetical protein
VGPAGRGSGRIAGGAANRKGALGLDGSEFTLLVMGEQCRDFSRSVRTGDVLAQNSENQITILKPATVPLY